MKEEIVALTEENIHEVRAFCGLSGRYLGGHKKKLAWFKARWREGLQYKLYRVNGHNAGFIEYTPGEYAWRGVDAKGYMFIHCFWVVGRNRGHGYGTKLLEDCLTDSKNYKGVAVVVSKTHWLPTPKIFLKSGFELVDEAPPSFELLVKKFEPDAKTPRFKKNWLKAKTASPGLTFFKSAQCPYAYVMEDGIKQIGRELNIPVTLVDTLTTRQAQAMPCVYGTMGIFFNGELVTYHPTGKKKLIELLEKKLNAEAA